MSNSCHSHFYCSTPNAHEWMRFDDIDRRLIERYGESRLKEFDDISKEIKLYSRSGEIMTKMEADIKEKESQSEAINNQIKELEEDIAKIQESDDYKNHQELDKDKG